MTDLWPSLTPIQVSTCRLSLRFTRQTGHGSSCSYSVSLIPDFGHVESVCLILFSDTVWLQCGSDALQCPAANIMRAHILPVLDFLSHQTH